MARRPKAAPRSTRLRRHRQTETRWLLGPAGVPSDEERLYRAMLSTSHVTTASLAAELDLPVDAVEDTMTRLVHAAFALPTDDGAYTALDPAVAVRLAATRRELALVADLDDVRRLHGSLDEILQALSHATPNPERLIDIVSLPDHVERVRGEVLTAARHDLRCVVLDSPVPALGPATNRRVIYRGELLDDIEIRDRVLQDELRGVQPRVLPQPLAELIVADAAVGLLGLGDGRVVVLHPSPLLAMVTHYFDLLWQRAMPLGGRVDPATAWQIDAEDLQLLRYLAMGLTDQAIARSLGIGLRTVVRRVGHLAHKLDAETRFQLAVQATRRGLLRDDAQRRN